ncbi:MULTISPECIES: divalent-cation tolerance protein CutA [Metallosphaera]|uniref:CutA1 divalent ion tolerance protein n=3 Tax=Metallosphaera TaxID=41980 RepID=A4YHJ4_METS5|nr:MULTISPECIES: divalent-cation tolerance protein CutA [Metallosphaera]ABP95896.1 CutA1 divalent ion tolerance protein [Metallosphaera sedula DSM 5348]AIM27880.1 CutA1 divalent ion tolerance protein [Metallosphaera sedula]AKV74719.1 cation tolerance protein CutA [Metallosphaera sedula]AKV76957.1 cation tolerance protein CutA [Metallosphaera sedula]AKV79208.1 cation tolerance protein CutA [Metallosphaera sedula]
MTGKYVLVISTLPGMEEGKRIARTLVEEKLAACVNLVPGLVSIYRWEGKVTEDSEVLALIKTNSDRLDELMNRLKELHPYKVPEILALDIKNGFKLYLDWIDESVSK